ncbi:MAG: hypothetical protein PWQ15_1852 [Methanobacterium sp.]|jgi:sporulation protein YlmC with PRC-barrel domain|uniref:PRC-barrel domain-containing protein n=1 Tax=Methanobacterium sp. TaxID=2164 RepID=UPI0003C9BDEB|nr:PRC-barrel domain-containing protein [Methanobacterium sp.]MDI3550749.1 hypothetical protein [Methanobacterium sp.]CDG65601.1 PRC-barrel domain-containing protein [Methanobacterium sp. MB1]
MKVSEFIGMKVIDIEARDVGKVEDLGVTIRESLVEQIFISIGSTFGKKFFAVKIDDITAIGDYVQVKFNSETLKDMVKTDKLDDLAPKQQRFKGLEGKIVLSKDGVEIGKIQDLIIDPEGSIIHNVVITMGGTFNRKHFYISNSDVSEIGDYMILKLSKEQIEEIAVN